MELPAGGHFYFSSEPTRLAPVAVDDELAVFIGGEERYVLFLTYSKIVELQRSLLEQWSGQTVTVAFRDRYGSVVGSSPVWLIWEP
jgi:hypothetical protein